MIARLKARIFSWLQRLVRRRGMDLQTYRLHPVDPTTIPTLQGVDLVLDVGAAAGIFGRRLRNAGYEGRIYSFEPLSAPFRQLERVASKDPGWSCMRVAIGREPGEAEINVAGNSQSSSLLPMGERHARGAPESVYIGTENIKVETVDGLWEEVADGARKPFLKIDAQGYEMEVLRGAVSSLPKLHGVQAEVSLVPLYEGAPAWTEVIEHLQNLGFHVANLEPGFTDPATGEVLQADVIFTR